jgi:cation/acetate symporter
MTSTYVITVFLWVSVLLILVSKKLATRTKSAADFYLSRSDISSFQNGVAMAGDYISGAAIFGISSLIFVAGCDGFFYAMSFVLGWTVKQILITERARNIGRFTVADIISYRLNRGSVRAFTSLSTLAIIVIYLVVQFVAVAQIFQWIFGLSYVQALLIAGLAVVMLVSMGGFIASSRVQVIKIHALFGVVGLLCMFLLASYDFSLSKIFNSTNEVGGVRMEVPLGLLEDPVALLSLAVGLVFGTSGLPHTTTRYFSVMNAKQARQSAMVATGVIVLFFLMISLVGVVAVAALHLDDIGELNWMSSSEIFGTNMVILALAHTVTGDLFLGCLAAITFFATLTVIAKLISTGASSVSRDIYVHVIKRRRVETMVETKVARLGALLIGVLALCFALLFEQQNLTVLVSLAFSVAASSNFPILLLSLYWKGLTSRGALIGGLVGLVSSLGLILTSKLIWVDVLKNAVALYPYDQPALFGILLAFATAWLFSITDRSDKAKRERLAFEEQYIRSQIG